MLHAAHSDLFLCFQLFVSQPRVIVFFYINGTAMDKAQLGQQILHDMIVTVGVNPQMAALPEGPVQAEGSDAALARLASTIRPLTT